VNPVYDDAEGFFLEGLIPVCEGECSSLHGTGKWGFIDQSGKLVVPPQFAAVDRFHEGLAGACVGGCDVFNEKADSKMGLH
jgi:hypothetical protein